VTTIVNALADGLLTLLRFFTAADVYGLPSRCCQTLIRQRLVCLTLDVSAYGRFPLLEKGQLDFDTFSQRKEPLRHNALDAVQRADLLTVCLVHPLVEYHPRYLTNLAAATARSL